MQKAFESKLTLLQGLSKSWSRNALFNSMAVELMAEIRSESLTAGIDRAELSEKIGALKGCIAAQEFWLESQVQGVIAQSENQTPRITWAL